MSVFSVQDLRNLISEGKVSKFYESRQWKQLSRQVIAEYHGECFLCRQQKKLTKAVLVHHVRPLREYPELAYSRTYQDKGGEYIQLMPLCFDCHERIHRRGAYAKPAGYQNEEKW